jgi:hypothetical protein
LGGTDEEGSMILTFILIKQYITIGFRLHWLRIGSCVGFYEYDCELKLNKKLEFIEHQNQDEFVQFGLNN